MIPLLKRIFCVFLAIFLPIALFPVSAFAVDPVSFTEAETLGAVIVDLYGAYNNTSLAYQNFSDGSALTEIVSLYNEYSQSASDPYTLAAIGAAAVAAGTVAVIYDAITGKGYIQLYQEQYVSSLDGFWDYSLVDWGFVRDNGLFVWNENDGVIDPVLVSSMIPGFDFISADTPLVFATGQYTFSIVLSSPFDFALYSSGSSTFPTIVSDSSFSGVSYYIYRDGVVRYTGTISSSHDNNYDVYYYDSFLGLNSSNYTFLSPLYSSRDNLFSAFTSGSASPATISLSPSVYIGDPLLNPESIEYPDPSSPDYAPRPVTIQTNVEWDDDWGSAPEANPTPGVPYPITDPATLNNLVPDLWSQIVAGTASVEAPQPDPAPDDPSGGTPSEVFIPLLPVTLPDFNFSLSGIWHYVVTWVQSLGSWFTMMFTVWNSLPYAMVVPVYATAVIVIVLGVYKRFFM